MARSFFSQWAGLVVTGLISVILTPILVHGLGSFYYGMWILVASVLDYYGLLDLGIRYTLQRFVSRYHARRDRVALNESLATALLGMCGVGVLLCGLSLALAAVLPGFFGLTGPNRLLFRELVVLEGLSASVVFPARLLGAYLCGLQRFDLYNLVLVVVAFLRAVLFVAVLGWGFGVLGVVVVGLGVAGLSLGLNWRMVRRADPTVSFHWRLASWARLRELSHFSVYVFLSSVGDQLRFYTDSIVIARLLAVALTTPFNIVTRLIEYYKLTFYPVTGPLTTSMSSLDGQARRQDLQKLYLESTRVTVLLSLWGAVLLLLHGRAVLRLWVGPGFVSSYPLLLILVIGYLVTQAQLPSQTVLYAQARHRALAFWTLGEGAANLVLSIYWATHHSLVRLLAGRAISADYYGLAGVALGTAVPMLFVRTLVQPWYVLRVVGLPVREYVRKTLARPLLVGALFVVICWLAQTPSRGTTVFHLAFTVGWQTLLFAALAYLLGFSESERRALRARVRQRLASLRVRAPRIEAEPGGDVQPIGKLAAFEDGLALAEYDITQHRTASHD